MMSAGATQHLQGLVARKSVSAEPAIHAQYFSHVADLVRVNDDLTVLRCACPSSVLAVAPGRLAIDSRALGLCIVQDAQLEAPAAGRILWLRGCAQQKEAEHDQVRTVCLNGAWLNEES